MLRILTLSLFALALVAGEAEQKLPAAIQTALDRAEAEVAKNRAAYDKANEKPLQAAEKAIQAELDKLTKSGKLEDAMAAKKVLEGLRGAVVARVDEKSKGDLLGESLKSNAKVAVVGKWKRSDGYVYVFNDDGTGNVSNGWQFNWTTKSNNIFELIYTSSGAVTAVTIKGKSATFTMETGTILGFERINN